MTQLCYLQDTHFVTLEMDRKIYHANTSQKRAGVDVLVSDTKRLQRKGIKDKERHCRMLTGSVLQDNTTYICT